MEALRELLHDWERWAAELLEEHLSYPVLAYFRSQHDNQSWLAALTAILDTCALVMAGLKGTSERQAELTFAMARHAVVDLSLVFRPKPRETKTERLSAEKLAELRVLLAASGLKLSDGEAVDQKLTELRQMYEPYVHGLATYFRARIPPWVAAERWVDNWQVTIWERGAARKVTRERVKGEHF